MRAEPDTRWEMTADGRVTVSEVWLEIVGRTAPEAPGYRWFDDVHPEDRHRVEEIAAHMAARRAYATAFRVRHHTGRYVWVHSGGKPQADGGYLGWTRVARSDRRSTLLFIEAVTRAVRCLLIA